jgi:hypothetical protein
MLIWKASTSVMNPTVPEKVIAEAYERDPASAAAEYGAEFRTDIEGFLDRSLVDAAVGTGVTVRSPLDTVRYAGFADPSGGSRDSFTAAIGHAEADTVILDALYERRPPFNPSAVVAEIADLLRSYRLTAVTGDRYAAGWVTEAFAKEGITYTHNAQDRSQLYLDALPLFTSGRVRLLDNPRLAAQLAALERHTSPAGRDRIDHPVGSHDDSANSCCGMLALISKPAQSALIPGMGDLIISIPCGFPEFATIDDTYSNYLASTGR